MVDKVTILCAAAGAGGATLLNPLADGGAVPAQACSSALGFSFYRHAPHSACCGPRLRGPPASRPPDALLHHSKPC